MDLAKEIKDNLQNKTYPMHEKLIDDAVNILTKEINSLNYKHFHVYSYHMELKIVIYIVKFEKKLDD